jgi:hypothetical protein
MQRGERDARAKRLAKLSTGNLMVAFPTTQKKLREAHFFLQKLHEIKNRPIGDAEEPSTT